MTAHVTRQSAINVVGGTLAMFVAGCMAYCLYALVNQEVPTSNRDALMVVIGGLLTALNLIINWFFGSSSESKKQSEAIANQAETIKTAQAALTPTAAATVSVSPGDTVTVAGTDEPSRA